MRMQLNGPCPAVWEDGLIDSKIEAQLTESIRIAKPAHLPRDLPAPQHTKAEQPHVTTTATDTLSDATLTQLIAGCGIAVVDGYLAMRDYATAKGVDLVELHHKGIDFQDLVSTAMIHVQRMAEMEGRARWKR